MLGRMSSAALAALPLLFRPWAGGLRGGIASASSLMTLSLELLHTVPEERLREATSPTVGKAVLMADYLMFTAVEDLGGWDRR